MKKAVATFVSVIYFQWNYNIITSFPEYKDDGKLISFAADVHNCLMAKNLCQIYTKVFIKVGQET
jgi:hypothetical protein